MKTEAFAKHQQHMKEHQANLAAAAADAALPLAKAAAGAGGLGASDVALEGSGAVADTEVEGDDVSGDRIGDEMWDALEADPEMTVMIAELQAREQAC